MVILKIARDIGTVILGLGMTMYMIVLIPVLLVDMLRLGTERPEAVVWFFEVLRLQYSPAEVWAAFPLQWPALWNHIGPAWMVIGVVVASILGMSLALWPLAWLVSQDSKNK